MVFQVCLFLLQPVEDLRPEGLIVAENIVSRSGRWGVRGKVWVVAVAAVARCIARADDLAILFNSAVVVVLKPKAGNLTSKRIQRLVSRRKR